MQLLIIGANGQLGWELCRRGREKGFDIRSLDLPEFDITDRKAVQQSIFTFEGSLVINAAAYTAVDKAESEAELVFQVNRDGPAHLADACSRAEIPLIHISTDYVFDGTKMEPYSETDPVSPLGIYGKSKADGEARIRDLLDEHIIMRTAWLYGVHGHNFVKIMLRMAGEQEIIRVVGDQYGCPTYAGDLADAILYVADLIRGKRKISWGTYHYCGKGKTTWHGFAEKIFEMARQYVPLKVKHVEAIATKEYPTAAKRPAYSILDCSLIERRFGISPRPWQQSLSGMLDHIFNF